MSRIILIYLRATWICIYPLFKRKSFELAKFMCYFAVNLNTN